MISAGRSLQRDPQIQLLPCTGHGLNASGKVAKTHKKFLRLFFNLF
jgi:hypothetical protein